MQSVTLYNKDHRWIVFGRDTEKPEKIIDTNQYMIINGDNAILLDPGGIEIFSTMLTACLKQVEIQQITDLFVSHQDPDIVSSLGMWDQVLDNAKLYCPWLWEGFVRHFGIENMQFMGLQDEGGTIMLGDLELLAIPAHYLHSSGNFNLYDPKAKILFSGDIGAALEADDAPLFVDDFEQHVEKMRFFHQRWMPSNQAKQVWLNRVQRLEIDMIVPQHGRIFRGEQVQQFLEWFGRLEVGVATSG